MDRKKARYPAEKFKSSGKVGPSAGQDINAFAATSCDSAALSPTVTNPNG